MAVATTASVLQAAPLEGLVKACAFVCKVPR
jgi:hypothetical protein